MMKHSRRGARLSLPILPCALYNTAPLPAWGSQTCHKARRAADKNNTCGHFGSSVSLSLSLSQRVRPPPRPTNDQNRKKNCASTQVRTEDLALTKRAL